MYDICFIFLLFHPKKKLWLCLKPRKGRSVGTGKWERKFKGVYVFGWGQN